MKQLSSILETWIPTLKPMYNLYLIMLILIAGNVLLLESSVPIPLAQVGEDVWKVELLLTVSAIANQCSTIKNLCGKKIWLLFFSESGLPHSVYFLVSSIYLQISWFHFSWHFNVNPLHIFNKSLINTNKYTKYTCILSFNVM